MWWIPGWAIGVAFSAIGLFVGVGLMARLMPPEMRTSRRRRLTEGDRETLQEMEGRLNELQDLHRRLVELEGRVDFAERLLTRQREADRLAAPQER